MFEKYSLEIKDEEIVFADLTDRENLEAVAVAKSGNIYLYDLERHRKTFLSKLPFDSVPNLLRDFDPMDVLKTVDPSDLIELIVEQSSETESIESLTPKNQHFVDGLPLKAKLYSFQDYICIVEQFGTAGVVLNLANRNFHKKLERGDYGAGQCSFPIAFYSEQNSTFLIHGTDWNRLDITCLETGELLTGRTVDYDTDSNYFDYFHSSLLVSPDEKHFTSNGWHWHPYGQITLYSIADFLKEFELSYKNVELTEDCYNFGWDRPLCWVDEKTLAAGFSKNSEEDGGSNFPDEILLIDIQGNEIVKRIEFNGFGITRDGDVFGELFYDPEKSRFISLNSQNGLFISDLNGKMIFEDRNLIDYKYSSTHKLFYHFNYRNRCLKLLKL